MVCVTFSKFSICFDPLSHVWALEWEPAPSESEDIKQKNPAFWIKHCYGCHEAAIFWTYSYICYCHSPLNRVSVAKQYSNHVKFFWKQWIPVNIPLGYILPDLLLVNHEYWTEFMHFNLFSFSLLFCFYSKSLNALLQKSNPASSSREPVGGIWEEGTQVGMLGSLMHVFYRSAPWISDI